MATLAASRLLGLLRATAGSLGAGKGRLSISIAAIALGVALGYAVQLVNRVAVNEFAQAVQTLSGTADLVIRGPRGGFSEQVLGEVAQLPEVAAASPIVEVEARIPGRDEALRLLGIDVFRAGLVQPGLVPEVAAVPQPSAPDSPSREMPSLDTLRDDTVFLNAAAMAALGMGVGDFLPVQVGTGIVRLRVAGEVRAEGHAQPLAVMDIAGAQWRLGRLGRLGRIDLRVHPGVDVAELARRIGAVLPPGVAVERPSAAIESTVRLSRSYRVNLNVLALVALFTGGLLVFSTQALAVVRRRPYLALLRVLGLTRGAMMLLLLLEAAAVGAVGALVGLAGGYALAELVLGTVGPDLGSGFFRGVVARATFEPAPALLFLVLGIATALLGSLAAANEAARTEPAQALKAGDEQRAFRRLTPVWPGLAFIALGAALAGAPPVNGLPVFGYAAIACLLVGTILLLARIARAVFDRIPVARRPAARLAVLQLRGAPGQATVSLAAIVASVSLLVSMAIMVASFRQSLDQWLQHVLPADLYLRAAPTGDSAFLPPDVQEAIAALPGVRRVEFLRSERLLLDARRPQIVLLARPIDAASAASRLPLVRSAPPPAGAAPPAWVSEVAADLYGFDVGQEIELPIGGRSVPFHVAGVWRDYARQQGAVVIERALYAELTGDRNANDAAIHLEPGAAPESVARALRERVPGSGELETVLPAEIRQRSLAIFDRTFAVTYALETAALAIGLMGLSSSFGALVLARRREFGVLRHLGLTRAQVGAMLAAEGGIVSALGLGVGAALGWIISLILIHVVNRQSFHWSMDLHVPWGSLAAFTAIMLGLASLTALASGRQAMGGDAVRAVKEDW
ncbi:MAG: ABC transporter permease [Burkholderiales bacterium]|nr:ABC transporter permease [Burkholderiales bacterium]